MLPRLRKHLLTISDSVAAGLSLLPSTQVAPASSVHVAPVVSEVNDTDEILDLTEVSRLILLYATCRRQFLRIRRV